VRHLFGLLLVMALAGVASAEAPICAESKAWKVCALYLDSKIPAVGVPDSIEIALETLGPFHVNDDYPMSARPTPVNAVAFDKPKIVLKDGIRLAPCNNDVAHHCRAQVPVRFVASKGGRKVIGATLAFSACDDEHCLIEKVEVAFPIEIFAR
jgi:hypothetical protein